MLPTLLRRIFSDSLPRRAWLVVGVIACLAISAACTSAMLAWIAKADAKAINAAGMMRMASYRISYLTASDYQPHAIDDSLQLHSYAPVAEQLIQDMDIRLNELSAYQSFIANRNPDIDAQLFALMTLWQDKLAPAIRRDDKSSVYQHSAHYVNQVDTLTHSIQKRNEQRQHLQQLLQLSALSIIILILMAGMNELRRNVLRPINALLKSTYGFQSGIQTQTQVLGYREFQELGTSFNIMAETIHQHQEHLHQEVIRKTKHLTQTNQVLTLLYNFAKQLNNNTVSMSGLYDLMDKFAQAVPHIKLSLCIHGEQKISKKQTDKDSLSMHHQPAALPNDQGIVRWVHDTPNMNSKICNQGDCNSCDIKQTYQTKVFGIYGADTQWGELLVQYIDTDGAHGYDDTYLIAYEELLTTLANLIGMALSNQKQRQQEHQLVLLEERNTIARELHDSLAQSLSYLKIQLAMLGTHSRQLAQKLEQGECSDATSHIDQLQNVLTQARAGLDGAYTQLRELLVTFRLKIESGNFDSALQQACDEFAKRGQFDITLNNRVLSLNMTAGEQIDLLQIAREALSNIQRHAKASQVSVELYQQNSTKGEQLICLTVSDDGVGLRDDFDTRNHHGLLIMQERTNSLGGSFSIRNNKPKGTQVCVTFLPKFFSKATTPTAHTLLRS